MLFEAREYFPAVHTWHHDVEQNEEGLVFLCGRQCLRRIVAHCDTIAGALKVALQQVGRLDVIVDHEEQRLLGAFKGERRLPGLPHRHGRRAKRGKPAASVGLLRSWGCSPASATPGGDSTSCGSDRDQHLPAIGDRGDLDLAT